MAQDYGIQPPRPHRSNALQEPARFLVLIDSGAAGARVARLFLASRAEVAEFDAAAPEVGAMIEDLSPTRDASAAEWDEALAGHNRDERAAAEVYTLEI